MKTKLDDIINEHLLSMTFSSDAATPTETALFLRMKDVAIAYSDYTNSKLLKENERLSKSRADLVIQLSAANERIKELEKFCKWVIKAEWQLDNCHIKVIELIDPIKYGEDKHNL